MKIDTISGTVGGTVLSWTVLLSRLSVMSIIETAILALTGAVVSFFATLILRRVFNKSKLNNKKSEI